MSTLGNIIELQRGYDITKDSQVAGQVPVVSSSGINSYHNQSKVSGPGVVIGRKGTLGTVFYIDRDYWPHDTTLYVKDFKGNDPRFIYYFLKTFNLQKFDVGSANPTLNRNHVHLIKASVPSLRVQTLIAQFLNNLDTKISLNNRINATLEAMAKTIYDYWFVQFNFPISKDQAKAMGKPKLEGKPYKASGGKMLWSEQLKREVPEGWQVKTIDQFANVIDPHPSHRAPVESKQGFPFAGIGDIDEYGNIDIFKARVINEDFVNKQESDYSINETSLGYGRVGTVGKVVRLRKQEFRYALSPTMAIINPKSREENAFVYFNVKSESFYKEAFKRTTGTTRPAIGIMELRKIPIVSPSSDHYYLVSKFETLVSNNLKEIELLNSQNQKLSKQRDWLLPMLMNGQVRFKELIQSKVAKQVPPESKPANSYFYQTQLVAAILNASKKHKISHGEMTLAKYTYLVDKLYGVPTYFNYERLHLGPYPKEMKKIVNNKKFFKIQNSEVLVVPQERKYNYQFQKQVEEAVADLASILKQYKGHERSHQTELFATVCKVVEDVKSTDLKAVRESMKNWPINLKTSKFQNKAEKFGEEETMTILKLIVNRRWLN
jgi:type I restriction enzyme S subunit